MSPGRTANRVYDLLKAQIMDGFRRPGERLDPARLAVRLSTSATPVRDALHQLLGERLVEAWPREGFKVPVPTEAALRDLYRWHGDLTGLLLRGRKSGARPRSSLPPADSPPDKARVLFVAIAQAFGHEEFRHAIDQAQDRLHRARRAEAQVFTDYFDELRSLSEAWSSGRLANLRRQLERYHRRRHLHVAEIVAKMIAPNSQV
ncbi:GntR family transcriptional regulator [Novosphingobium sp. PS1R-30]|uniref:GntR family transcriptional regulator n=1 Tax=Novosphingobium anseongense TaxID=3133436 RepID=A0ABU8S1A1_9SPHN